MADVHGRRHQLQHLNGIISTSSHQSLREHILHVRRRSLGAIPSSSSRRAASRANISGKLRDSTNASTADRRRAYDDNDTLQDIRPAKRARLDDGNRVEPRASTSRDQLLDDDLDRARAFGHKNTTNYSKYKKMKRHYDASRPVFYNIGSTAETKIDNESRDDYVRVMERPDVIKHVYARTMTPGLGFQKRQELSPTATAGLNPAQITSLLNSITTSRSLAASAVASSLGIDSRFEAAASRISSRRGETYTGPLSTVSSSATASSSSSASGGPSSSDQASSASRTVSGEQNPSATGNPTQDNSSGTPTRNIVIPAVVVPVGFLLLALLIWWWYRKRERNSHKEMSGRATPASLGGIRGPFAQVPGHGPGGAAAAGLTVPAAAAMAAGRPSGPAAHPNTSAESFATSPSAIGVAYSEPQPRTRWGRRSLTDVIMAGAVTEEMSRSGSVAGGSVIGTMPGAHAEAGQHDASSPLPQSPSFGGRQPSITGLNEVEAGGLAYPYSSYRPGMPRPLMATAVGAGVGGATLAAAAAASSTGGKHHDPFAEPDDYPSIVPVPHGRSSTELMSAPYSTVDHGADADGSASESEYDPTEAGDRFSSATVAPPPQFAQQQQQQQQQVQTQELPPAITTGSPPFLGGAHSRTNTQTSTDDAFYSAADAASSDDNYEALYTPTAGLDNDDDDGNLTAGPLTAPVDFGSSSGSGSGSASGGSLGLGTPRPTQMQSPASFGGPGSGHGSGGSSGGSNGSHAGTPRLGAGHGSMSGVRKGDGSWW